MEYIQFLEARVDPGVNKGLANFDVSVKDQKWKEVKNGFNVSVTWCFSAMVILETICDLFKIVDFKGVRFGPRDKEVSVASKHIFILSNGDVVAAVPPVHLTYHKKLRGTFTLMEKVDV